MKDRKEIIDHLFQSACGYGMAEGNGIQSKFDVDGDYMPNKSGGTVEGGKKAFAKCINAIPEKYFEDFLYTLYRIADKSGSDGFSID
jgi:hypothetical protein